MERAHSSAGQEVRGKANAPYAVKCRSLFPSVGGGDGLRMGSNKRVLVSLGLAEGRRQSASRRQPFPAEAQKA
ncbi:hypothetical protein GQ607_005080 [Colletotrichum asianum]|uniref:Uncharacterized protein n=1 Tax=Colletotrichum asianum TaxID=702518 RepID=A0A8H3ZUX5_9PEZI|nr:hypothetical protein GQ607_005080 [Colletotrichum asianum]